MMAATFSTINQKIKQSMTAKWLMLSILVMLMLPECKNLK